MLSPLPPIWICKKLYFAWAQSRPLPWLALSICLFAFLHRAEPRGEDKGYKKEKGRIKFFFSWAPKSLWMVTAAMKLKDACSLEGNKSRKHIKKQRYHFTDKGPYSQSCGFSSSYVQMWELDHNEGCMTKNWHFWIVVLDKTVENPFDSKEI